MPAGAPRPASVQILRPGPSVRAVSQRPPRSRHGPRGAGVLGSRALGSRARLQPPARSGPGSEAPPARETALGPSASVRRRRCCRPVVSATASTRRPERAPGAGGRALGGSVRSAQGNGSHREEPDALPDGGGTSTADRREPGSLLPASSDPDERASARGSRRLTSGGPRCSGPSPPGRRPAGS